MEFKKIKDELRNLEFNKVLDQYLIQGRMDTETYLMLTPIQQEVIQCYKRAYKRLGLSTEYAR